jgi:hypothetical protein
VIWYLDQLVHPEASEDTIFVMLKFYMDESGLGKNTDEKVCCVAGFVAKNADWKKFSKHWADLLGDYNLDEFHSKEFWTRNNTGGLTGKYAEWSFADANEFMGKVIALIASYKLFFLGAAVDLSAFFSYPEIERKYLTGALLDVQTQTFITHGKPTAAYFVAFNGCIVKGLQRAAERGEMAHFVFDEQNEFSPRALERIAEIRETLGSMGLGQFLGDAVFSCSRTVLPLQTADLAAYCCKEHYKRKMTGASMQVPDRPVITGIEVLVQILEKCESQFYRLGKQEMDGMLRRSRQSV